MKQVEAYNTPEQFLDHVEQEISNRKHRELHDFHGYLRDQDMDSGTILGYLRKADRFIGKDGGLVNNPADSTALCVYKEYRVCCDTSTEGDTDSQR